MARARSTYQARTALVFDLPSEGAFDPLTSWTDGAENEDPTAVTAADVHVVERRGEPFPRVGWGTLSNPSLESGSMSSTPT